MIAEYTVVRYPTKKEEYEEAAVEEIVADGKVAASNLHNAYVRIFLKLAREKIDLDDRAELRVQAMEDRQLSFPFAATTTAGVSGWDLSFNRRRK